MGGVDTGPRAISRPQIFITLFFWSLLLRHISDIYPFHMAMSKMTQIIYERIF